MLTSLFLILLIGALSLLFVNNKSLIKQITLGTTIVNFIISLILWGKFDNNTHEYQFVQEWAEISFCHFNVGIDGISLFFVLLTTFLFPIIILTSWDHKNNLKNYLLNFLILVYLSIGIYFMLLSTVAIPISLPSFLRESEILFTMLVPIMIYSNADLDKFKILAENKGKAGIYMWSHISSGKFYIGSAVNLSKRIYQYLSKSYFQRVRGNSYIYNTLQHHGYSAFSLTIYEEIDIPNLSLEQAKKIILEQFYMDSLGPEYNINPTAGSRLGSKHSAGSKALMSSAKSGENHPMFGKTGDNHPRGMLGKIHSPETKALLSKAKLGIPFTEGHKTKISNSKNKKIFVYTLDSNSKALILHLSFNSCVGAIKFFGCSTRTLSN